MRILNLEFDDGPLLCEGITRVVNGLARELGREPTEVEVRAMGDLLMQQNPPTVNDACTVQFAAPDLYYVGYCMSSAVQVVTKEFQP